MQNLFDMLGSGNSEPARKGSTGGYVRMAPPATHAQPQMQLPSGPVQAGNPYLAAIAQYGPEISRMFEAAAQQRMAEQFAQAHPLATPAVQADPATLRAIDQRLQPSLPEDYGQLRYPQTASGDIPMHIQSW